MDPLYLLLYTNVKDVSDLLYVTVHECIVVFGFSVYYSYVLYSQYVTKHIYMNIKKIYKLTESQQKEFKETPKGGMLLDLVY